MKIKKVETIRLDIPFTDGGAGLGMTPSAWNQLDMVLVRIETDTGLVGWGEAFSYFCAGAVKSMLDDTVIPMLIGLDANDPRAISDMLQRRLVLFGRYGITIFALSGIDSALWDVKAKAAGKSLVEVIGGAKRDSLNAYASLVRYGDPAVAAKFTQKARSEGYRYIKLHEVTRGAIGACDAARGDAALMVDVNCSWSPGEAKEMARFLASLPALWLEEPTFPPEDFGQMKALSKDIAISAGENLCTSWQFRDLIASGAVKYPQPSVTKVGGISEILKIITMAESDPKVSLMPHSPYFGPGYLATLHICAALRDEPLFEYLYVWPDAWLYRDIPKPVNGKIALPTGVGLGLEPDPDVVARYRVN